MPSIRDIELEASRRAAADGRTSHRERFQIRNQLRSQYGLDAEDKKRGGVAGVWDRNKGAIGSVAGGLAASFIPGAGAFLAPALGGILGGSAARGRFEGGNVLGDALGGVGGGGVKSLASSFMPQAGARALPTLTAPGAATNNVLGSTAQNAMRALPAPGVATNNVLGSAMRALPAPGNFTTNAIGAMSVGAPNVGTIAPSALPSAASGAGRSFLSNVGGFVKDNPEVVAMGTKMVSDTMQGNANRAMADRSMDFQERQYEDEQERRRRIAELLAPMWQARQAAPAPAMPGLPMLGGR